MTVVIQVGESCDVGMCILYVHSLFIRQLVTVDPYPSSISCFHLSLLVTILMHCSIMLTCCHNKQFELDNDESLEYFVKRSRSFGQ